MGLICRDFFIAYILTTIGLILLVLAVESLLGADLGGIFGILPQIIAAMMAGQFHGRRSGTPPESGFSWKAAGWMTLISFSLSIIAGIGFILFMGPGDASPLIDFIERQIDWVIGIVLVFYIFYFLISRYFFGLGAKHGVKHSPNADADIFQ